MRFFRTTRKLATSGQFPVSFPRHAAAPLLIYCIYPHLAYIRAISLTAKIAGRISSNFYSKSITRLLIPPNALTEKYASDKAIAEYSHLRSNLLCLECERAANVLNRKVVHHVL